MSRITAHVLAAAMAELPETEDGPMSTPNGVTESRGYGAPLPYGARRDLDVLAADLRKWARLAKDSAARTDIDGDTCDAEHWAGRANDLMDIHGRIVAVLTADRTPIEVGDEITVQRFDHVEGLPLTNIDAHFDVLEIRNGMVGFARTMHRGRPCASYVNHWAPLTAVERVSDGHRCPDVVPTATGAGTS